MSDIIKNDCPGETFNINTWPETIWLQNENSAPFSSSMFGEICWCHEQINEADVAYVRDDIASAAVKAIRGAKLSRLQAENAEAREIIREIIGEDTVAPYPEGPITRRARAFLEKADG